MHDAIQNEQALAQELDLLLAECRTPLLRHVANLAGGLAASNDVALDALQEASLRYWMARRAGAEFENPKAWMFRVAHHYVVDQLRKGTRQRSVDVTELSHIADPSGNPEHAYQQMHLARQIGSALSPRERTCISHRLDGMSYQDIGRSMGIATNTVGVLINRASKKLLAA